MSKSEVADNTGPKGVNDKQLQGCSRRKSWLSLTYLYSSENLVNSLLSCSHLNSRGQLPSAIQVSTKRFPSRWTWVRTGSVLKYGETSSEITKESVSKPVHSSIMHKIHWTLNIRSDKQPVYPTCRSMNEKIYANSENVYPLLCINILNSDTCFTTVRNLEIEIMYLSISLFKNIHHLQRVIH